MNDKLEINIYIYIIKYYFACTSINIDMTTLTLQPGKKGQNFLNYLLVLFLNLLY